MFGREERTFDLPEYTVPLAEGVKRVVVDMAAYPHARKHKRAGNFLLRHLFGCHKGRQTASEQSSRLLGRLQKRRHLVYQSQTTAGIARALMDTDAWMEGTLLVPGSVQLEVTGAWHELELNRKLNTNWRFEQFSDVTVHLAEDSDVQVLAAGVRALTAISANGTS